MFMTFTFDDTHLQTAIDTLDYPACATDINAARPNRTPISAPECRSIARAIQVWLLKAAKAQGSNFKDHASRLLDEIAYQRASVDDMRSFLIEVYRGHQNGPPGNESFYFKEYMIVVNAIRKKIEDMG
jgi:hypothetical protein